MTQEESLQRVVVFGGTGFLGSRLSICLAGYGLNVRIATRHPDGDAAQETSRSSQRITAVYADVRDETSVELALDGCDAAINAVGLYVESDGETFEAVHELGAVNVAHQATAKGLRRLLLVSGIGADVNSPSTYVRARGKAELLVSDVFADATVLRPSVIFGPQDKFVNTFELITRRSPVLPLFGRGETRLQPVYVGDVAEAAYRTLLDPRTCGEVIELGGPGIFSYRALIELILSHTRRRRMLFPVPFAVWQFLAKTASVLPKPPITEAQVTLVKQDNVVGTHATTLADLGVRPTALEDVLSSYAFTQQLAPTQTADPNRF